MLRLLAIATLIQLGSGCRYWSAADSPLPSQSGTEGAQPEQGDDWTEGRLPSRSVNEQPRLGGEIVAQLETEPPSLNPIVDSDWLASQIANQRVYDSLVELDPYDHPRYRHRPCLAERWEVSSDQRTYTFYLRHGVRWHDGAAFTSRDVVATFDKIQDPNTKAMHIRSYTRDLEAVRTIDDFTVEFRFSRPYFLVLDGIFADVPIQPAHVLTALSGEQYNAAATNPINRHPIGTGRFRFESWTSNQSIVLRRNDSYWGRPPYVDRLVFRIVKEATISLEMAGRQELDIVTRMRPEQWVRMDRSRFEPHYVRSRFYDVNYSWVGYNENRRFFQDSRVRRAMTLLIDRPGMIRSLQHGLARPTTCHFYADSEACDPLLKPLPYDPLAAAKLLDEAGWRLDAESACRTNGGEPLAFSLMIPAGSEGAARTATLIKESLSRAGVEMRLQRVEWSAFVRRLRDRDFDACVLSWANSSPRSDPTQIWHSSSIHGGSNYIGFSSPRADALIDSARSELDEAKRNGMFRELGQILYDEQPYTWLYVSPRLALIHRRVRGAFASLAGWRYEDWWLDGERGGATKR